jgi:hypothetical protein
MKTSLTILSSLIGLGCSSSSQCAAGFGMDAKGACVKVGNTASTDTASANTYTPSEDTSTSSYTIPEAQWDRDAIQAAFSTQITDTSPKPTPIFEL